MGLSSAKTKQSSSQTQNMTTTPQVAPWLNDLTANYAGHVGAFGASDPHQYVAPASSLQSQAFAGAQNLGSQTPIINNAISMAQNAPGITAPTPVTAAQSGVTEWRAPQLGNMTYTAPVNLGNAHTIGAESLLTNLNKYMNPYTNGVVDSTLANYDRNTGQQAAALQAQQARSGAFGGSRAGIAQGQFQADAGMNRGMTEYGLRRDAFNTGAQLSSDDANRRQGASTFNAGAWNTRDLTQGGFNQQRAIQDSSMLNQRELEQLGVNAQSSASNAAAHNQSSMFNTGQTNQTAQFNSAQDLAAQQAAANQALQAAGLIGNLGVAQGEQGRADLGMTADLGNMQHSIDQAYAGAPLAQLLAQGQMMGSIPYGSFTGQNVSGTTTGTSTGTQGKSPFDIAMSAATLAAMSDRRAKKHINKVGDYGPLGIYTYHYNWDADTAPVRTGVMADEVEKHAPHALGPMVGGYQTVNYGALGLAHLVGA